MAKKTSLIFTILLISLLFLTPITIAQDEGPPTPEEVFVDEDDVGHNFDENYFDIMVYNNSKWEVEDPLMEINNMTTWVNNTWNIKWINEGNFEMLFLAFMNKSGIEDDPDAMAFTPAQFWYMHYYYEGHEMLIGNMLTAWFGWSDSNENYVPDPDEDLTPYFYMTIDDPNFEEHPVLGALDLNTEVEATPLLRNEIGGVITYSWSYNYSDMLFFVPKVNHTLENNTFEWGFEYNDPGSYFHGSSVIGVHEFISYEYTLVLDPELQKATLSTDYISGEIKQLFMRDNKIDPWVEGSIISGIWVPPNFLSAVGNWAFILAGMDEDYTLLDSSNSSIDTTTSKVGLTQVSATVSGDNVFNYEFAQKPNYEMYELGNPENHTTDAVVYESLDIETNEEFIDLVSGMTQLIGPFAQLLGAYAINQTNHFTNGIDFGTAWDIFDPTSTAALFCTGYPLFGEYKGGRLEHDPTFSAFYTPGNSWSEILEGLNIPGYSLEYLMIFSVVAVVVISVNRHKK